MRRASRATALVAAGSLALAQGCASTNPVGRAPLKAGATVSVTAMRGTVPVRWQPGDGAPRLVCEARQVRGTVAAHAGDTLRLRTVTLLVPFTPRDSSCTRWSAAEVVVPAEGVQVVEVVAMSPVRSAIGAVAFAAAVGLTILLIYNLADGIIDAISR